MPNANSDYNRDYKHDGNKGDNTDDKAVNKHYGNPYYTGNTDDIPDEYSDDNDIRHLDYKPRSIPDNISDDNRDNDRCDAQMTNISLK
jgi:hypothetical protein